MCRACARGLQIEKDSNADLHKLLHGVSGLDGFTPKSRFLTHDEGLECWLWFQGVHEAKESRSFGKFCPTDAVINIDVLLRRNPPFLGGIRLCVLNLPRNRLFLVAEAILFSRFSGVDGRNHTLVLLRAGRCV